MNKHQGFTFIELLVTVTIAATVITVASRIFFSSLKGDEKTRAILEVKQVGNQALNLIVQELRAAQAAECEADSITITDLDGEETTFSCNYSSGRLVQDGERNLTGADLEISSCQFSFLEGDPETVEISFTLSKRSSIWQSYSLDFRTTVLMRNY